jgi:uncharacterized protein YidB (DUF937 family)
MNQLITEIKNKLTANHPVEADDIYSVIDLFDDNTIRRLEALHDQTGLDYRILIRTAVIVMSEQ